MADVRLLFDKLIVDYGEDFNYYLAPGANIVCSPAFENAIVAQINGLALSDEDEAELKPFIVHKAIEPASESVQDNPRNYGLSLLQAKKKVKCSTYKPLEKVPVTSNVVERFFSHVKLTLTTLRNNLLPSTLEMIMFLKINGHLWNPLTVQKAIKYVPPTVIE